MQPLQILLLGTPEIIWEDKPFSLPRRTARMLLFFLAARCEPVNRGELISVLWENVDEADGKKRLRDILNKLRGALPDNSIILTSNDLISLNLERVYVDLCEFKQIMKQADPQAWKIPHQEQLPDEMVRTLTQAVTLWRSPIFMAGADILDTLGSNQWFRILAEQAEQMFTRAAERLTEHEIAAGDLESALHFNDLILVQHEWEEKYIERRLRLLLQLGRSQQAWQDYQHFQDRLYQDYGGKPGIELQNLFNGIKPNGFTPAPAAEDLGWQIRPSAAVRFIGRQNYLNWLRQAYQNSHSLILLGESGQGKTRLLEEFAETLTPAPFMLLAQCRSSLQNLPLQPLIDALRRFAPPRTWTKLPLPVLLALTPLFPELVRLHPDLPIQSTTSDRTRTNVFEALRQVFAGLGMGNCILLIVDDAHWADATTLFALAYLMQHPPLSNHGMVLMAARVEEQSAALRAWIESNRAELQVLQLGALNLKEITELAGLLLGGNPPSALVERLSNETGGNTLYILETLRVIAASPKYRIDWTETQLPLAESITELLENRLCILGPVARRLLETAAVAGSEFAMDVVCTASQLSKAEAAEALDELEERYLVEPISVELPEVRYGFIHDKVKEALLACLNPLRLQVLHRQVADAILAERGAQAKQRAALLAWHYELAGDWQLAFPWWVKAVERARELFGAAEGAEALAHAERIMESHFEELDEGLVCHLYRVWSEHSQVTNNPTALQETIHKLLLLGEQRNSALLKGTAYLTMAELALVQNQFAQGESHARQAIAYLEQTDNLTYLIQSRADLGVFQYLTNQVTAALHTLEEALVHVQCPQNNSELSARASLYYQLGLTRSLNGWPAQGFHLASLALEDYRSLGQVDGEISAYSLLTLSGYVLCDYAAALKASDRGLELAALVQARRMNGYLHSYRGMVELGLGHLDELNEHITQAIEISNRYGYMENLLSDFRILGDAYLWLQDFPRAISNYERSNQGPPELFLAPDRKFRLCLAHCLHNDPGDYYAELEQAVRHSQQQGQRMVEDVALMALAEIHVARKEWPLARAKSADLFQKTLGEEWSFVNLHASYHLAMAEMHLGQVEEAVQRLETILNDPHQPLHAFFEITALCALIYAQQNTGRPTQPARQRLEARLADSAAHCTHPDFLPSFQSYQQRVRQAVDACQPLGW